MGYWAEAWTLPHVTPFQRKIAYLPFLAGSQFSDEYDKSRAHGSIILPADYERINEVMYVDENNPANDKASLIRIYRTGVTQSGVPVPVFEFYTEDRDDQITNTATGTTTISGREITPAALGRITLLPYDFPHPQTFDPDWVYGGDNVLQDPGFEESFVTNEITSIYIFGATGGSWSVTVDANTTAPIPYPTTRGALQGAIEALGNVTEVRIDGEGTPALPFHIEFVDPGEVNLLVTASGASLTGPGPVLLYGEFQAGGALRPIHWEKSRNPVTNQLHGEFDLFRIVTTFPDGGVYCLLMDGRAPLSIYEFPGVQQIPRVEPGRVHRASIRFRPDSATDVWRLVIRDPLDGVTPIAASTPFIGLAGLAGQYNTVTIPPFKIPDNWSEVIYRFAYVGGGDPSQVRVDTALLALGQPASTVGFIWLELLDDVRLDHLVERPLHLAWLDPTFTDLLDTDLVAWSEFLAVTLAMDTPYNELADNFFNRWGYEHRIRWNQSDLRYKFGVFRPGGLGVNYEGTGHPAITVGSNVLGGPMVMRAPRGSFTIAHGDDGSIITSRETSLETAWGPSEVAIGGTGVSSASVQSLVDNFKIATLASRFGSSIRMSDAENQQVVPIRDFKVGDLLTVNLGSRAVKRSRRVRSITVLFGERGRVASIDVQTSTEVYASSGVRGLAEGVRRLLMAQRRKAKAVPNPSSPLIRAGAANSNVWSLPGNLFTHAGSLHLPCPFPNGALISRIDATIGFVSTGASVIFDVHKWAVGGGSDASIFVDQAARPTIAAGAKVSTGGVPQTTTWLPGETLILHVDQVGSAIPGGHAVVMVLAREIVTSTV